MELKVGFIGGGNMASALIGGICKKGHKPSNIFVSDPSEQARQQLAIDYDVQTTTDNQSIYDDVDVLVLAVKPQHLHDVCSHIKTSANPPLIVSIAAGITCTTLENWLNECAIVRCMPNTPALIQQGATGLFANSHVTDAQKQMAEMILQTTGITAWVDNEKQLDAITALSGSGPAYFFYMIEAMQAAGEKLGLDKSLASTFAIQTALGAAALAQNSDDDAKELRRKVTSPGGTTAAAINVFEDKNLSVIVDEAMKAADSRAKTLSDELS